ncbi:MAG: ribosome maturation factor RimM [Bacteroidales bacterium]|nr:ribosome maturation factor RimM [Bacteroidales bacterium]
MINLKDCYKIGYISKPHGIKGHVVLRLSNLGSENIMEMEWGYLIFEGLPVPFFIEDWQERPPDSFLVKFEDVSSVDEALKIVDAEVYIDRKFVEINVDGKVDYKGFIGFQVVDKTVGEIGILEEIMEIQENPMMRIMNNKQEILIPLQDEFVIGYNVELKKIDVQVPAGLLDLN